MKKSSSKRTIAFVLLLTIVLTGAGCVRMKMAHNPGQSIRVQSKIKLAQGPLVTKTYRKLGISISLPKDVLDVTAFSKNWFQRDMGYKELGFYLAMIEHPFFSFVEPNIIWSGHVNVFTPEQFREWSASGYELPAWTHIKGEAKSGTFDLIEIQTVPEQRVGLDQKDFRIARKAKDGSVLIATMNRCEYTIQTGARERDLHLITNILQSVKFLEP